MSTYKRVVENVQVCCDIGEGEEFFDCDVVVTIYVEKGYGADADGNRGCTRECVEEMEFRGVTNIGNNGAVKEIGDVPEVLRNAFEAKTVTMI